MVEDETIAIDLATKIPAVMSWSGGKDSAYALYKILQAGVYDVQYLLSTFKENPARLSGHGVREELIECQAKNIGIPLLKLYLQDSSNARYEAEMNGALSQLKAKGVSHIIFGDINLQDLRQYREQSMAAIGMHCVFPLWQMDTAKLLEDFIDKKFQSSICCIMEPYLSKEWLGRLLDESFVAELPANVDPCGENGEYHSFCFDGPIFSKPVFFTTGGDWQVALEQVKVDGDRKNIVSKKTVWYRDFTALQSQSEEKICENCGSHFICNMADIENCQCYGLKVTLPPKDSNGKRFTDCLCAACLKALCV